jgi:predicted phosphodiesterase
MKIAVCSDVHLEFGPLSLENTEGADVLILSGDICVAKELYEKDTFSHGDSKTTQFHTFFQECCARFLHVVYIAGNHEHYNGDYAHTIERLRHHLGYLVNLHILDKEFVELNGVCFAGGTLWTDMNKEDPVTMTSITGMMNDYRIIENGNRVSYFRDSDGNSHSRASRFSPEDSVIDHKAMLKFIDESIKSRPDMPWVVVGHHSPSKQSTKPRYENHVIMNGAYSSDLSEFILDRPQIKLWTHGHTHDEFDYMIGSTRIVCNPRGYIYYEDRADEFELKFIEV